MSSTSRVLVVDRTDVVDDVGEGLVAAGLESVTTSGPEVDRSTLEGVDCVVCGHDPPTLDGLELLERVRERFVNLPFVLYPQAGDEAVASAAVRAGVTDYVPRNAEPATLAERVRATLSGSRPEHRLERLHEATRELMTAPTADRVADIAVRAAADILGFEVNAIWFRDDQRLVPAAETERSRELVGEPPIFEPGESLAWQVYESGEPRLYGDIREAPVVYNESTQMRSEILLPLGEHGVFIAGSSAPNAFDEADTSLARVFAANVEAALTRAEREQTLRERDAALQQQNERLSEFTSVVSHDLRNPLSIAQGRLELAREEHDSEHLAAVDRALTRMSELIEDLLALARQGEVVGETEPVDLAELAREVWTAVDGGRLRLADDLGTVDADRSRLRQLLENLLLNAVDHGGTDVTVEIGQLADEPGFYIADDGPGIPAEHRNQVFDHGFTTSEDGTGFGLAIVRRIAEAHGWEIEVTESAAGGARFEIRTASERPERK